MRPYLLLSGVIFAVVALLHLLRLVYSWPAQLGAWTMPMGFSWIGLLAAGTLAAWAFSLSARR